MVDSRVLKSTRIGSWVSSGTTKILHSVWLEKSRGVWPSGMATHSLLWYHILSSCLSNYHGILILEQEALENFVFPDEIKTKLMKMNKLITFVTQKNRAFYAKGWANVLQLKYFNWMNKTERLKILPKREISPKRNKFNVVSQEIAVTPSISIAILRMK